MPAATPLPLHLKIAQLHQAGLPAAPIAWLLTLPQRTVRHLLTRWRPAPRFTREAVMALDVARP